MVSHSRIWESNEISLKEVNNILCNQPVEEDHRSPGKHLNPITFTI